jgi:hypothetical protein
VPLGPRQRDLHDVWKPDRTVSAVENVYPIRYERMAGPRRCTALHLGRVPRPEGVGPRRSSVAIRSAFGDTERGTDLIEHSLLAFAHELGTESP